MPLNDFLDDREPHSRAAAKFLATMQAFEDAEDRFEMFFGDADAVVLDIKNRRLPETAFCSLAGNASNPSPVPKPISIHFSGLSLYFIELVIRLRRTSPMRTRSPRMIGSGSGMRTSTPVP